MKNILMCLLIGSILSSCAPPTEQGKGATGDSRFHTTPPSALYFKNMRSTQYVMHEQAESRIEVYRHKQFGQEGEQPALYPVIANNWLQDEAYLFLQRPEEYDLYAPLTVTTDTSSNQEVVLKGQQVVQQYTLAITLYEGLQEDKHWFIKQQAGTFAPLYHKGNQRAAFMVTVRDYLKLTEAD